MKVVSIAVNLPGPLACALLSREGAQVLKIEPPSGDPLNIFSKEYYSELLGTQKVKILDLKIPGERSELDLHLDSADIFLVSSRPASLKRLNLDWKNLSARFPKLCMVAIVGHAGAEADKPGHDLTYQGEFGLLSPPEMPKTCWADIAAAHKVALAATALLLKREKTGKAGFREIAISESLEDFMGPWKAGVTKPGKILGGGFPGYNLYQTKNGWVALAVLESHFQKSFMEALGLKRMDLEELRRLFSQKTTNDWLKFAAERDIPLSEVKIS